MESIHSNQNPRIKKLVRLHSSRGRQKQNRIVIFGAREILRAIQTGITPDELFICEKFATPDTLQTLTECVVDFDSKALSVTAELFEKICYGDRSDGIVMTATRPQQRLEQVFETLELNSELNSERHRPLIAIAESIEKPGNLGAILRSADGAGMDAVVVADSVTDWFHPSTIRASLGTCFSLPGVVTDNDSLQRKLIENDFQVIVASLQGATDFYEFDLTRKTAIVVGNEAKGISEAWRRKEFHAAKLPMLGIADSLNVSAAATAMFYEARRQRSTK